MDYNVRIINSSGVYLVRVDNTGASDVSDDINGIINKYVDDNGLDLYLILVMILQPGLQQWICLLSGFDLSSQISHLVERH